MHSVIPLLANASGPATSDVPQTLFWVAVVSLLLWWLIHYLLKSESFATEPKKPAPAAEVAEIQPKAAPTDENSEAAPDEPAETQAPEEPEKAKPETPGGIQLDTATAEEAAAQFQADLDSGKARQDAALGILYDSAPEDSDDLKEIKGVAKVLEGKLHDFGIYKFKQIAFWTDTAVAEFAQRLSFRDRIYRDDWIAQAKTFHEKKYGEKL